LQSRARAYQQRADDVFSAWGFRAPAPTLDCNPEDYRRDLAVLAKRQLPYSNDRPSPEYSTTFAELRRMKLWGLSPEIFANFEPQVFQACRAAASRNDTCAPGELRQVSRTDPRTGLKETVFFGKESFVTDPAYGHRPGRRVKGFYWLTDHQGRRM
jgi:hypothetical protein